MYGCVGVSCFWLASLCAWATHVESWFGTRFGQVDNRGSYHRGHAFESVVHRNLGVVEVEDQVRGGLTSWATEECRETGREGG